MATVFSSLIGHVDESIEQRASLLAALKAKLDTADGKGPPRTPAKDEKPVLLALAEDSGETEPQEVPAVPAPPVIDLDEEDPEPTDTADPFSDVMAQLDRGLDARQQMIDALKAQLNKSVGPPRAKSGSSAPEAVQVDMPAPVPPAVQSKAVPAIQALHSSLLTGTVPPMPGRTALPPIPPLSGTACLPTVGMAPEPSMFMAATPMTPMTPMGPVGLQSMPGEPAAKRLRAEGVPLPLRAPQTQDVAAREAELAALAARKAQMLRSLGADVSNLTPDNQAAGPSAPPPVPEPPPGASPEEFEAYRQQCWRQYYQWCKVWQKYYNQSKGKSQQQGGGHGAVAGHQAPGKGSGKGKWATQGTQVPQAVQAPRSSPEDDIHSQLLGL